MMFPTILILFAFSVAPRDCAFITDLQNSDFHLNHRETQFMEGVGDRFRNLRGKSLGQAILFKPLDLNPGSIFKLRKDSGSPLMERLMFQPRNFMLDLSTIKFDPRQDWGFHIGNWYIIRKTESDEDLSYSQKNIEDWINWNDFMDARDESEKRNRGMANKERGIIKETYTTSKRPMSEYEITTNALNEEKNNSNDDNVNVMDELSVEVLKPVV